MFEPRIRTETGRENDFELVYKEDPQTGEVNNTRRPFDIDLAYPVPELKPLIGKPIKPLK